MPMWNSHSSAVETAPASNGQALATNLAALISYIDRFTAEGPQSSRFIQVSQEIHIIRNAAIEYANRKLTGGDLFLVLSAVRNLDNACLLLSRNLESQHLFNNRPKAARSGHRGASALFRTACQAAISVALGAALLSGPSMAQSFSDPLAVRTTPDDLGVMDRPRPEYDAQGLPLGDFRAYPETTVAGNYDSNIYRLPAPTSDYFLEVAPTMRIKSDWGRHFLEVYGGLDNFNYLSNTRLNLTDWTIGGDGRYDISQALNVSAAGSYGKFHEPLASPSVVGFQITPNRYNKAHGELTAKFQPGRLGLAAGASIDRLDFQNAPQLGGGFIINTDRDESEYQAYGKAFYEFSPGYSTFLKVVYDERDFDLFLDRSGQHRASHGAHFDVGADLQITHLLAGEAYIGYVEQDFSQKVALPLPNVSGVDFGLGLDWFATPLMTVHLDGHRTISDITLAGASAADNKIFKISADYEFQRDIIVQAFASYTNSQLIGTPRDDNYPGAGLSVKYLVNSYASVDLGYKYDQRLSNISAFNFADHLVTLGVTMHL